MRICNLACFVNFVMVCFAAVCCLLLPATLAQGAAIYHITELKLPAGMTVSEAYAINAAGQVVGAVANPSMHRRAAVRWTNGKAEVLGMLPPLSWGDFNFSVAYGINTQGDVVGASGNFQPVVMSGLIGATAFLYRHGELEALGKDSESFMALGINDSTQIVGAHAYRGFLWADGKLIVLDPLSTRAGGNGCWAKSINAHGQIAGATTVNQEKAVDLPVHACLWQADTTRPVQDLGTLPDHPNSFATQINAGGDVVGYTSKEAIPRLAKEKLNSSTHACYWKDGKIIALSPLTPGQSSKANALNNGNIIVGQSGNHAVRWLEQKIADLNTLIDDSAHWTLDDATGINDGGQIIGQGMHDGKLRAYLLSPIIDW